MISHQNTHTPHTHPFPQKIKWQPRVPRHIILLSGSRLFDSGANNNDKKRLALAVMVNRFRSQSSPYFRAHPVFVSCLNMIMNQMQNDDQRVSGEA